MTSRIAVDLINDGHTCSESILMAYAPKFGLTQETAARIAAGFAGGAGPGQNLRCCHRRRHGHRA
jgi:hypothetical protein